MSKNYPGGIISKTPPTPSGAYSNSTAPGVWTLEDQAYWQKLGQWPTQGNTNPSLLIESLFNTYLTTGAGANITVTNGVDLSTNGGLVWNKTRNGAGAHTLFDTIRGVNNGLITTSTNGQSTTSNWLPAFNTTGFEIGTGNNLCSSGVTGVSWTFRKQAKFFDMVSWTGDGSYPRTISHNLGSTPGCIIIKAYSTSGYGWFVWHRSLGSTQYLMLNNTNAAATDANIWGGTPTSTTFSVGSYSGCNVSGISYVAYLYANDAGGFGASGSENVVSCGSYTGTGAAGNTVSLGYEPQWVMIKAADRAQDWFIFDVMRGMTALNGYEEYLVANTVDAAGGGAFGINITPTGLQINTVGTSFNASGEKYVYVVIRRGPMATPTVGTSVYNALSYTGNGSAGRYLSSNNLTDVSLLRGISSAGGNASSWTDRMRGGGSLGISSNQGDMNAYWSLSDWMKLDVQTGMTIGATAYSYSNANTGAYMNYTMSRAPGFLDVVSYVGTGSARTITHNLTVQPQFMVIKAMTTNYNWFVYTATTGATNALFWDDTAASTATTCFNSTAPTSSVFSVSSQVQLNESGTQYIAYLFSTVAGVSKIGSYTGTGALQTVNCGFTTGARFVMIKRTDTTGDWYTYDSVRGISSSTDPYFLENAQVTQTTGTNYVDTASTGFQVTAAAPAALNASGGTYIFIAIA